MCRALGTVLVLLLASVVPASARQAGFPAGDALLQCLAAHGGHVRLGDVAGKAGDGFDAGYYAIDLDLTAGPLGTVVGRTRVAGRSTVDDLHTLDLDLDAALRVDSVMTEDGHRLTTSRTGDVLSIDLPDAPAVGEAVDLTVFYRGEPEPTGFAGFSAGTLASGVPYVWTLSEPYGARTWWPSVDHPSDKADSVAVRATVPDTWSVASNGVLQSVTHDAGGTATWQWKHRYPISTYLVSIAAAPYDYHRQEYVRPDSLAALFGPSSFPVEHYSYPGYDMFFGATEQNGWRHVLDVMAVEEWWFGPYPFEGEKYGHAQMTRGGGMEHQTMTSMGGNYVGLVAHELTHQWYGDAIGPRTWPHLWLNEGFATMGELLVWETLADRYPDNYAAVFDLYYRRARNAEGTLVLADTSDVNDMFRSARVYSKGAMVLHMLRKMMGDETFRAVMRSYAQNPALRYGTATSDDFRRVAETVSGTDLDTFFRQWVTEGTGYPEYAAEWSSEQGPDGWLTRVVLSQTQDPSISNVAAFEMPVEIRFETESGPRAFTVADTRRSETFEFTLDARPTAILVDPDRRILRGADVPAVYVGTDRLDLPAFVHLDGPYPNPAANRVVMSLEVPRSGPADVEVVDATGRIVRMEHRTVSAGAQTVEVGVEGLSNGLYLVRVRMDGLSDARSVIVMH